MQSLKNKWAWGISRALFLSFICFSFLLGCQQEEKKVSQVSPEQQALIERGKAVYIGTCTVCHHLNPKLPGGTGPEVYGSSLELLEARIMRAEYPAGYKPKRDTQLMPSFEEHKDDIKAIHAYLNSDL